MSDGPGNLPGARLDAGDSSLRRDGHQPAPSARVPRVRRARLPRGSPSESIRTAQNLNSGIFPMGSIASFVRRFAAASRKWNGMKHPALLRALRLARTFSADRVASRRQAHHRRPRCRAPRGRRVQLAERLGLDRVEGLGAARHRARVPVLQGAAGVQHERVLRVGQLRGRQRPRPARTCRARSSSGSRRRRARRSRRCSRGPGQGHSLPAPPRCRSAGPCSSVSSANSTNTSLDVRVLHAGSPSGHHVAEDLPVEGGPRPAAPAPCWPSCTRRSVFVYVPTFSKRGGRGQDDVGELGGLGEEDVLHHEEVELAGTRCAPCDVGVGEERVLTDDVHAADAAVQRRLDDLDDGLAGVGVELRRPTPARTAPRTLPSTTAGSPGTSSGSGPRRTRPARCSARAAGAGPCRAGRRCR